MVSGTVLDTQQACELLKDPRQLQIDAQIVGGTFFCY